MKKQLLIIATLSIGLFSYAGDQNKTIATTEVSETATDFKYTPKSEYTKFLTDDLIASIGANEHEDILGIMEAEAVEVKVAYFTPPGWDHKFAYVQINYYMGGNSGTSFLFFYPNDIGKLSDDRYSNASSYDQIPCNTCQLTDIEVTKDEKVIGHFYNVWEESEIITKTMDYNFREMTIYWEK